MKVSTALGRTVSSLGIAAGLSIAAHNWNIPFFYYLGGVLALAPWFAPIPPLPKIGDYEDD